MLKTLSMQVGGKAGQWARKSGVGLGRTWGRVAVCVRSLRLWSRPLLLLADPRDPRSGRSRLLRKPTPEAGALVGD